MNTREFDIENYNTEDIISKMVRQEIEEALSALTHPYIKPSIDRRVAYYNLYSSHLVKFKDLPKLEQKKVITVAKEQYKTKKAKSIKDYKDIRKQCDEIFHDDNTYKKLTPELGNLYYCQAYTALYDFKERKLNSKAVSNSRFQARAMSYSKIACD